jgi:hypothetical protein
MTPSRTKRFCIATAAAVAAIFVPPKSSFSCASAEGGQDVPLCTLISRKIRQTQNELAALRKAKASCQ